MPFGPGSDVIVKQVGGNRWELTSPLSYSTNTATIEVPVGLVTDFTSVPRFVASLLPPYDKYARAAVLRDYLWRGLVARGEMRPVDADEIFRDSLREIGVAFLHRWMLWAAARWAALTKTGGTTDWWRYSWRVVLVTLASFPVVLPVVLVNTLAWLVFDFADAVLWVPVTIARMRPSKVTDPVREARHPNTPSLGWKT